MNIYKPIGTIINMMLVCLIHSAPRQENTGPSPTTYEIHKNVGAFVLHSHVDFIPNGP